MAISLALALAASLVGGHQRNQLQRFKQNCSHTMFLKTLYSRGERGPAAATGIVKML